MDRSANPIRCTNNRLACSHRMAACAQYRQAFPSIQVSKQVMQRNCVMKDRREESMLSNRLSGLLEILGRDKVTMMVDRLSPIDRNLKPPQPVRQNSQTAVRRRRLRVGRSHWGQWLYHDGRSIVPNRSEPEAAATSKTKQPNSRKTPTLARRTEPLGTMALPSW